MTADASKASAKVRSEIPGRTNEAEKTAQAYEKKGEALASSAGKKFDEAVSTKSILTRTHVWLMRGPRLLTPNQSWRKQRPRQSPTGKMPQRS